MSGSLLATRPVTSPLAFQLGPHAGQVDHLGAWVRLALLWPACRSRRELALAAAEAERPVGLQPVQVGPLHEPRQRVPFVWPQLEVPADGVEDYPAAADGRDLTTADPPPVPASGLTTSPCTQL